MGFDGAGAERAATGVREAELLEFVEKWAHQHDDRASASGGFNI